MKNNIIASAFAALFLTLLCACGDADKKIVNMPAKTAGADFVIGIEDGYPPYAFKSENGKIEGYDIEMLSEVAKRNHWNFKLKIFDWDQRDNWLDSGKIDVIASGIKMEMRENMYEWTKPYMQCADRIMTFKNKRIRSINSLKGKTVGMQTSTPLYRKILIDGTAYLPDSTKIETVNNFRELTDRFFKGDFDAIAANGRVAKYWSKKNPDIVILNSPLMLNRDGYAFKLGNGRLRDQVQSTLEAMASDGTISKLTIKWFGEDVSLLTKKFRADANGIAK